MITILYIVYIFLYKRQLTFKEFAAQQVNGGGYHTSTLGGKEEMFHN